MSMKLSETSLRPALGSRWEKVFNCSLHVRAYLVTGGKVYRTSHRMFGHMHEVLNVDYL
jgi:hypothetical protein